MPRNLEEKKINNTQKGRCVINTKLKKFSETKEQKGEGEQKCLLLQNTL